MLSIPQMMTSPYAGLLPSGVVAGLCCSAWLAGHLLVLQPLEQRQAQLDTAWTTARQHLARRMEAKQTIKDLAQLLALLPSSRDFSQLPLAMSEEAKRNNVRLSGLSYTLDKGDQMPAVKVTFKGPVTGRYEDLRRFIYHLESSDRLLFIEDLDVGQSITSEKDVKRKEMMTFTLQISTYIRQTSGSSPVGDGDEQNVRKASTDQEPPGDKTGKRNLSLGQRSFVSWDKSLSHGHKVMSWHAEGHGKRTRLGASGVGWV